MVKISEDKFALLYWIDKPDSDSTGLIIIDSNGNVIERREYDVFFSSNTQPIYYDNSILWIDCDSREDFWYEKDNETPNLCRFIRIYL